MFPFLTREFSCKFTCTALSFLCLTEKKESLDSSAGAEQRGNVICCCFYGRWAPCSKSACHTNPDQIHCHLTSSSAEKLNVHHSATGIYYRAVGTLHAIACYVAIDANSFCHKEAKDKLLLIVLEDV